jgi:4-carboxymuconolactone decarboxylase
MTVDGPDDALVAALQTAAELLGGRLEPFLEPSPGEPANASDFTRLATVHTFGDAWHAARSSTSELERSCG